MLVPCPIPTAIKAPRRAAFQRLRDRKGAGAFRLGKNRRNAQSSGATACHLELFEQAMKFTLFLSSQDRNRG
jgi:hypothetical protein